MGGSKINCIKSMIQICLILIIILSIIQIKSINRSLNNNAIAGSCWTQSSQLDFLEGNLINLTAQSSGDVELCLESVNITDSYSNRSRIQTFQNLKIDSKSSNIQLSNIEIFYVSEGGCGRHGIVKAKIDGSIFTTYGIYGNGTGQFRYPNGIDYDKNTGFIFVADRYNHKIVKTKIGGTGWTTYGEEGSGLDQFNQTTGLHYDDATQNLYIGDWANFRVVKTKFGGSGWETYTNSTLSINDVHYDSSSGFIHCAHGTGEIFRTKLDGTQECKFGTMGIGINQFQYPRGIYYDDNTKLVYVADMGNDRIAMTKMDGSYWKTFGTSGSGIGQLDGPADVVYDSSTDFLYILDSGNSRIVKTRIDGTDWQTLGGFLGPTKFCVDLTSEFSSNGLLISKNILVDDSKLIKSFGYNASSIPPQSSLKIQFSRDSINWFDSSGMMNGWNIMEQGFNKKIDLSSLDWDGNKFFYKIDFSGNGSNTPLLAGISLEFSSHKSNGVLTSSIFDKDKESEWGIINWITTEPQGTAISIETRTGNTTTPDFTWSPWTVQTNNQKITLPPDQFIQYRATFTTNNLTLTPILQSISINYNHIPKPPILLLPMNDVFINNSQPYFKWTFIDLDSKEQTAFQIIIDDDNKFESINYDSGIQYTSDNSWLFPNKVKNEQIADGIWYWQCRTKDSDGSWGSFSQYYILKIDTTPPNSFVPISFPNKWSPNTQPQIIFSTTDEISGIDHYELRIDDDIFSTQSSPYKLPPLSDGIHNISIRAYDKSGNYIDAFVDVYIDTMNPESFVPSADPNGWTGITKPIIDFSTIDVSSGISHYEVSIDNEGFLEQSSPYTLPLQTDGIHNITVRAIDKAGNYIDGYVNIYIDSTSPNEFTPSGEINGWITNNQPQIIFSTTDSTSGIDHYEVRIDDGDFQPRVSPYILPHQTDGIHTIMIRAYDKAGNYKNATVNIQIDSSPPKIIHKPITMIEFGKELIIYTNVTDEYSKIDNVTLFYKAKTDSVYSPILMDGFDGNFSATIPEEQLTSDIEYYIEANDNSFPQNVIFYGLNGETITEPNSETDIDISIIRQDKHTDKDRGIEDKDSAGFVLSIGIGLILIIIIIIILFLIIRKKKEKKESVTLTPELGREKSERSQIPKEPQIFQQHQIQPITQKLQPLPLTQVQPRLQPQMYPIAPPLLPQQNFCSTCEQPLTYYPQNNSYYCHQCQKYT
jgi:hypothetical protein